MAIVAIHDCPHGRCSSKLFHDEVDTHDCVPCRECGRMLDHTVMTNGICPACDVRLAVI